MAECDGAADAPDRTIAFSPHDHRVCVEDVLSKAAKLCAERGAQFTPARRRVLEILLEEHRPVGAYAVLEKLREDGRNAQPPTVYRALDFLIEHGLAHKVLKLNAFTACCRPGEQHAPQFLICTRCDRISELADPGVTDAVAKAASAAGFAAAETALELSGVCPDCADASSDSQAPR